MFIARQINVVPIGDGELSREVFEISARKLTKEQRQQKARPERASRKKSARANASVSMSIAAFAVSYGREHGIENEIGIECGFAGD